MKFLVTVYTVGSNERTVSVMHEEKLLEFLTRQMDEEPPHREKFTVEKVGKLLMDCS